MKNTYRKLQSISMASSSSCCSEDKVGMRKVKTKLGEFGKKWRLLCFEVFDQYCVVQSVMLKCKGQKER